jgi:FkbM family methyltransferase
MNLIDSRLKPPLAGWVANTAHRIVDQVSTKCRAAYRRQLYDLLPSTGRKSYRDKFVDLRTLSSTTSPTIVDGGAHRGQTIDVLTDVFDRPTIIAIEANPERAAELDMSYTEPSVTVHKGALGAESGEATFNVMTRDDTSSLRTATSQSREMFGNAVTTDSTITIQKHRLDDLLDGPPDILKLDLQGYEYSALKGAESWLDDVPLVLTETAFTEIYEGQELFYELYGLLRGHGFELFGIYDWYLDESGQLVEADVLFQQRKENENQ